VSMALERKGVRFDDNKFSRVAGPIRRSAIRRGKKNWCVGLTRCDGKIPKAPECKLKSGNEVRQKGCRPKEIFRSAAGRNIQGRGGGGRG